MDFFASPVHAQPALDQAVDQVDRAIQKDVREKLETVPRKIPEVYMEQDEPSARDIRFFVRRIELAGIESFSADDFLFLTEPYMGRDVSFAELEELTQKIEREYLKRGVLAACVIPPGDIKEGLVILQVIEAKMGHLEVSDHPHFKKARLYDYWISREGEALVYSDISRSLHLMNKNPDREVTAALRAGGEPGATDVILDVQTRFPIHLTASVDKEGSASTGKWRNGLGMKHNNFLGLDDTLLGGYIFGEDFSGYYVYHSLPVTDFGTTLVYGYSANESFPQKEFAPLDIESRSETLSMTLRQDIFQAADYLGEAYIGLASKKKTVKQMEAKTSQDDLRVLTLGANFTGRGEASVTTVKPEFKQGIDFLGADRGGSRAGGADETFTAFDLAVKHQRRLPAGMQASLAVEGFTSLTKLPSQEQFFLGGIDSVRGYPAGDFLAEHAVQVNAELFFPAFFIPESWTLPLSDAVLRDSVTPLFFVDYGYGEKRGSPVNQEDSVHLASIGGGLRFRLYDQIVLRLEAGFPIAHNPITENVDYKLHFSLNFEDRLPEELERLKQRREQKRIPKLK